MSDLRGATSYTRFDEETRQPYLEGSRCADCGAVFLGRRSTCGRCGSRDAPAPIRLADRGRLYSYTIVHRSYPGIRVPFVSAIVDLDGGGTVKGNLLDVAPDPASLPFDLPVRMVFRDAGIANAEAAGFTAHFFVPAGATA